MALLQTSSQKEIQASHISKHFSFDPLMWKTAKVMRNGEVIANVQRESEDQCNSENLLIETIDENNTLFFSAELVLHLFSFLDVKTLCRCAQTCTFWNAIAQDQDLWKRLYISNLQLEIPISFPNWAPSWKQLFCFHYECKNNIFAPGVFKEGRGSFLCSNGAKVII